MDILKQVFDSRIENYGEAMARVTRRHGQLSKNLANVNTPGYKRQDSDFNLALGEAAKRHQSAQEITEQRLSDQTSLREDGNNVDMEREVMGLADTELRYQALTQMTSDYFAGLKNAIREGR